MKNKFVNFLIIVVILIFGIMYMKKDIQFQKGLLGGKSTAQKSQIILFYGKGCPHCATVEKFIKDNNVDKKITFEHLEVYYNKTNIRLLAKKAKACGMFTDALPIPFLWDGSKCLTGPKDIITFFKHKLAE